MNETGITSYPSNVDGDTFKEMFKAFADSSGAQLTAQSINGILASAFTGDVRDQASTFRNIIEKEITIGAHLQTRKLSVSGLPWSIVGGNREKISQITDILKDANINSLMNHLLEATSYGYSGSFIKWGNGGGKILSFPSIDHANWEFDEYGTPFLVDENGERNELSKYNQNNIVFHKFNAKSGIPSTRGLCRTLIWTYFFKLFAFKHKARYLEKYGIPFVMAKLDARDYADEDIRATIKANLRNIGADGIGVFTDKTALESLNVGTQGSNADFQAWMQYLDSTMTMLILGQVASSGPAGGLGSDGQTQDNVRRDLVRSDAKGLEATFNNQIIRPLEWFKFGTRECSLSIDAEPPADLEKKLALVTGLKGLGYAVEDEWVEDTFSVPISKLPEGVATPPVPEKAPLAGALQLDDAPKSAMAFSDKLESIISTSGLPNDIQALIAGKTAKEVVEFLNNELLSDEKKNYSEDIINTIARVRDAVNLSITEALDKIEALEEPVVEEPIVTEPIAEKPIVEPPTEPVVQLTMTVTIGDVKKDIPLNVPSLTDKERELLKTSLQEDVMSSAFDVIRSKAILYATDHIADVVKKVETADGSTPSIINLRGIEPIEEPIKEDLNKKVEAISKGTNVDEFMKAMPKGNIKDLIDEIAQIESTLPPLSGTPTFEEQVANEEARSKTNLDTLNTELRIAQQEIESYLTKQYDIENRKGEVSESLEIEDVFKEEATTTKKPINAFLAKLNKSSVNNDISHYADIFKEQESNGTSLTQIIEKATVQSGKENPTVGDILAQPVFKHFTNMEDIDPTKINSEISNLAEESELGSGADYLDSYIKEIEETNPMIFDYVSREQMRKSYDSYANYFSKFKKVNEIAEDVVLQNITVRDASDLLYDMRDEERGAFYNYLLENRKKYKDVELPDWLKPIESLKRGSENVLEGVSNIVNAGRQNSSLYQGVYVSGLKDEIEALEDKRDRVANFSEEDASKLHALKMSVAEFSKEDEAERIAIFNESFNKQVNKNEILIKDSPVLNFALRTGLAALEMAPPMIATMLATAATGGVSAVATAGSQLMWTGIIQKGMHDDMILAGFDKDTAREMSWITSPFVAALEMLQIKWLTPKALKSLLTGANGTMQESLKKWSAKWIAKGATNFTKTQLKENATEMGQELLELAGKGLSTMIDKNGTKMNWSQERKDLLTGALETAGAVLWMGGMSGGIDIMSGNPKSVAQELMKQRDALIKKANTFSGLNIIESKRLDLLSKDGDIYENVINAHRENLQRTKEMAEQLEVSNALKVAKEEKFILAIKDPSVVNALEFAGVEVDTITTSQELEDALTKKIDTYEVVEVTGIPELDAAVKEHQAKHKGSARFKIVVEPTAPKGVSGKASFANGVVTLYADMATPVMVERLMRHEAVVHGFLKLAIGDKAYSKLLKKVSKSMSKEERGIITTLYKDGAVNSYKERYPDATQKEVDAHVEEVIADEWMAKYSEQEPTLFKKYLAKIRKMLKKVFRMDASKEEIHLLLNEAFAKYTNIEVKDVAETEVATEVLDRTRYALDKDSKLLDPSKYDTADEFAIAQEVSNENRFPNSFDKYLDTPVKPNTPISLIGKHKGNIVGEIKAQRYLAQEDAGTLGSRAFYLHLTNKGTAGVGAENFLTLDLNNVFDIRHAGDVVSELPKGIGSLVGETKKVSISTENRSPLPKLDFKKVHALLKDGKHKEASLMMEEHDTKIKNLEDHNIFIYIEGEGLIASFKSKEDALIDKDYGHLVKSVFDKKRNQGGNPYIFASIRDAIEEVSPTIDVYNTILKAQHRDLKRSTASFKPSSGSENAIAFDTMAKKYNIDAFINTSPLDPYQIAVHNLDSILTKQKLIDIYNKEQEVETNVKDVAETKEEVEAEEVEQEVAEEETVEQPPVKVSSSDANNMRSIASTITQEADVADLDIRFALSPQKLNALGLNADDKALIAFASLPKNSSLQNNEQLTQAVDDAWIDVENKANDFSSPFYISRINPEKLISKLRAIKRNGVMSPEERQTLDNLESMDATGRAEYAEQLKELYNKERKVVVDEWVKYLKTGGYDKATQSMILNGIMKGYAEKGKDGEWKYYKHSKSSWDRTPHTPIPTSVGHIAGRIADGEQFNIAVEYMKNIESNKKTEFKDNETIVNTSNTEGEWVKFPSKQEDPVNFEKNLTDLVAICQGTGWCTATGAGRGQLANAPFYVFVDTDGNARATFYMNADGTINQIRGIGSGQGVEASMVEEVKGFNDKMEFEGGGEFLNELDLKRALIEYRDNYEKNGTLAKNEEVKAIADRFGYKENSTSLTSTNFEENWQNEEIVLGSSRRIASKVDWGGGDILEELEMEFDVASLPTAEQLARLEFSPNLTIHQDVELPNLSEVGFMKVVNGATVNVPQLDRAIGNVIVGSGSTLIANQLTGDSIDVEKDGSLEASNLTEVHRMIVGPGATIKLPNLKINHYLELGENVKLSLPNLEATGTIRLLEFSTLTAPKLERANRIDARADSVMVAPKITYTGTISTQASTKVLVPDAFAERHEIPSSQRIKPADSTQKVIDRFGVTDNYNEAFFILKDGRLLDGSGKNDGGSPNTRSFDHREVNIPLGTSGTDGMVDFMKQGNIRFLPETQGLNLETEPSRNQIATIIDYANEVYGKMVVEVQDGNRTNNFDYPTGTPTRKIVSDILNFYAGNEVQQSKLSEFTRYAKEVTPDTILESIKKDRASVKNADTILELDEMSEEGQAELRATRQKLLLSLTPEAIRERLEKALPDFGNAKTQEDKLLVQHIENLIEVESQELSGAEKTIAIKQAKIDHSNKLNEISGAMNESIKKDEEYGSQVQMSEYIKQLSQLKDELSQTKDPSDKVLLNWVNGELELYREAEQSSYDQVADLQLTPRRVTMSYRAYVQDKLRENRRGGKAMKKSILDAQQELLAYMTEVKLPLAVKGAIITQLKSLAKYTTSEARRTRLYEIQDYVDAVLAKHNKNNAISKLRKVVKKFKKSKVRTFEDSLQTLATSLLDTFQVKDLSVAKKKELTEVEQGLVEKKAIADDKQTRDTLDGIEEYLTITSEDKVKLLAELNMTEAEAKLELSDSMDKDAEATIKELSDAVIAQRRYGMPTDIIETIREAKRTKAKNLTTHQVESLTEILKNILAEDREQKRAIVLAKKKATREKIDDALSTLETSSSWYKHTKKGQKDTLTEAVFGSPKKLTDKVISRYRSELATPSVISYILDGNKENGVIFNSVVQEIRDAYERKNSLSRDLHNGFNDFTSTPEMKEAGLDKDHIGKTRKEEFTITIGGEELTVTKGELISLYLHSKNEQNLNHIREGGIVKMEDNKVVGDAHKMEDWEVDNALAHLTEADKALAEYIGSVYSSTLQDAINEVSNKIEGFSLAKVLNYFPILTSKMHSRYADGQEYNKLSAKGGGQNNYMSDHYGIKNARQDKANNPLILGDAFDIFEKSTIDISRYYGFAESLQKVKSFLTGKGSKGSSLENELRKKFNTNYVDAIIKLPRDIEDSFNPNFDFVSGKTNKLLNAITIAQLGLNIPVALMQSVSYITAKNAMPLEDWVAGSKHLKMPSYDFMGKYSGTLASRGQGKLSLAAGSVHGKWSQRAMQLIGVGDHQAIGRIWYAMENQVKRERTDLEVGSDAFYIEVAKRTNHVIAETQPTFDLGDRNALARNQHLMAKFLSRYNSQLSKSYGINMKKELEFWKNPKTAKSIAKMGEHVVVNRIIIPSIISIIRTASSSSRRAIWATLSTMLGLRKGDNEDEDDFVNRLIAGIAGANAATQGKVMSLIYDFTKATVESAKAGNVRTRSILTDPLIDQGEKAIQALFLGVSWFNETDDIKKRKKFASLLRTLTGAIPLPVKGIVESGLGIFTIIESILGEEKFASFMDRLWGNKLTEEDTKLLNDAAAKNSSNEVHVLRQLLSSGKVDVFDLFSDTETLEETKKFLAVVKQVVTDEEYKELVIKLENEGLLSSDNKEGE